MGFNSTSLVYEYNRTFSDNGTYSWRVSCNDSSLGFEPLIVSDDLNISKDDVYPLIEYAGGTLEDGLNVSQSFIYVNVSVVEDNFANITYVLFNSTGQVNVTTYFTLVEEINWTGLPDEIYFYNVTIVDVANQSNSTATRRLTLDVTAPNASLISPENGTLNSTTSQNLTVNLTDNIELLNASLFVYNSTGDLINSTSVSVSGTEALVGIVYEFLYDGIFTWFYSVFDIAGNEFVSGNNTITIDTTGPIVDLISPGNDSSQGSNVEFSGNFSDVNGLENVTLLVWNSSFDLVNETFRNVSGTFNETNINVLLGNSDSYYWNFEACDVLGNCAFNEANLTFNSESLEFGVEVLYPLSNIVVGRYSFFNVILNVTCLSGTCGSVNVSLDPVGDWWDTEWKFRKSLHINSSSDGALTDYQKKIVVNYGDGTDSGLNVYLANKSKSDFSDIRFTNASGTELDHYFIQNDSTRAAFFVEIDSIPATGGADIYIYYNNSEANSSSNGSATFDEFESWDDAASSSIDTAGSPGIIFTNISSTVKEGAGAVRTNGGGDAYKTQMQNDNSYDLDDYIAEGWLLIGSGAGGNDRFGPGIHVAGTGGANTGYEAIIDSRSAQSPQVRRDTSNSLRTDGNYQVVDDTWYLVNIYRDDGTDITAELWTEAQVYGTSPQTTTVRVDGTYGSGFTGVFTYSDTFATLDASWVRKRTENEPVFDVWGTEEELPIKDGLVSTVVGDTPFYTNASNNPLETGSLSGGQSEVVTFWVNATSSSGTFEFFAFGNITSNLSLSNVTQSWNVTIDSSIPELTVISPLSQNYLNSSIEFNVSSNEDLSSCVVSLDSFASNYSMSSWNATYYNYTNTSLGDGNYTAEFYCEDLAFNPVSASVNFSVDTLGPNATLFSPENGTYSNVTSQNLTVNATDIVGLENATLFIYNETGDLINTTSVSVSGTEALVGIVFDFLYDGIFTWFYQVYDIAGNLFTSSNNTLIIDTTYAVVNFGDGTLSDGTNVSYTSIYVNVSVVELNEANISFSLSNESGLVNLTTYSSGEREINWTGLVDGLYSYYVYVTDLAGQVNSTETRELRVDTSDPIVSLVYPTNITPYSENVTELNFTIIDPTLQSCWYSLNDGISNVSTPCDQNISGLNAGNGQHNWTVYANDSFGHESFDRVMFEVNTDIPTITIYYPQSIAYPSNITTLNFSVVDGDLQSCWYTLDNGVTNVSTPCDQNVSGLNAGHGLHNWTVWANDTGGTEGFFTVEFEVDTVIPSLDILSPVNQTYHVQYPVEFNVSGSENLDYCIFSFDDFASNYSMTAFNQTFYNYTNSSMSPGGYLARFWCNDSVGNANNTESIGFSVAYPQIDIDLLVPEGNIDVSYGQFFEVSLNVSCSVVDCGIANVSLDPLAEVTDVYNVTGDFNFTVPSGVTQVTVLVVGGGGGAGSHIDYGGTATGSGGGGAGGLIYDASYSVTPGEVINITVGAGGISPPVTAGPGQSGEDSVFGTLVAVGGGGGGNRNTDAFDGGSGGGGGYDTSGGSGTAGQGFAGGSGTNDHGGSGGRWCWRNR
jgi:hypothetical protein